MPDDLENFVEYFAMNPLERESHRLLHRALSALFKRRKTKSIKLLIKELHS